MIDITSVIQAVAGLVMAVVTVFVVPYIRAKTTAEKQQKINDWVFIAVTAAEQIYNTSGKGSEKKEYVKKFLFDLGFTYSDEDLNALIESAVYKMKAGVL